MPIDKKEYADNWGLISYFIRNYRAKNKCEKCGALNGRLTFRTEEGVPMVYQEDIDAGLPWNASWPQIKEYNEKHLKPYGLPLVTKIILTVAHIDQDKNNNSFFNLAAWCQKCHLGHDRDQHTRNRKFGRNHKRGQLDLFK